MDNIHFAYVYVSYTNGAETSLIISISVCRTYFLSLFTEKRENGVDETLYKAG